MSFATSSSAFGIKPSSTSVLGNPQQQQQQPGNSIFGGTSILSQQPTQPSGLFGGQNQQQQPGGSLFGQSTQQQQQPAGGLFGQSNQQQQPGGLPGQSNQQQQQQQPAGGLFSQSNQQQQQPAGGLFGQSNQQQQPLGGGGLFGQSAQQQQPAGGGGLFGQSTQQQQPAGGGSLFGQSTQQQQPAGGGGLFGQSTQQPLGGGSLFGQSTQQQQPLGGGLFGQSNQQQPQQQGGGLFGGSTNANPLQAQATLPAGAFGGGGYGPTNSLFGAKPQPQPQQQQQQQQLGYSGAPQQTGPPPFTKSTKFNDLPDDVKRVLEQIDSHIQGCVQISKDLHQRKLGDEPLKGQELIKNIHKDLVNTASTIRDDLHSTEDLKAKVNQAVEDTIVATRIVDEFRNPQSGSAYRKDHAAFPLEYFTRVTEQMRERLAWYKSTIEAIERKLSASATQAQTPQGISATLQAQHQTFIALASKTAAVDAELQKIKALYTQLWRAKTKSVRDPFNDVDKSVEEMNGDLGMSGLNFSR